MEGLHGLSDRRNGGRIQVISGLIPLLFFLSCPLNGLDRSEQLIVFDFSLFVPVRIVTIDLVCKDGLASNGRDTLSLEHGEVVL